MKVINDTTMSCHVNQQSTERPEGEGSHIDLKLQPKRVGELPESQDWPQLGQFIASINKIKLFRTTGSKACGHTPGGYDDPFVDIAFAQNDIDASLECHVWLRISFEQLSQIDICNDVVIEVCNSHVFLPDGRDIPATRLWLRGERKSVEESFPVLLGFLAAQFSGLYVEMLRSLSSE